MTGETAKIYVERLLASSLSELKLTSYLDSLDITSPPEQFGDFSANAALILGKKLKLPPPQVAQKIIETLNKLDSAHYFESISEKNGFINFRLSRQTLLLSLSQILALGEDFGKSKKGEGKKIVFEYSSPSTNKPLHIGHTRNDLYGKACINLLKCTGHEVVACEIINDRGIHIMKSLLMYQKYGNGKTPASEKIKPDHFVGKFYSMFAQEASQSQEKEQDMLLQAQGLLKKWEEGDPGLRELWQRMNGWFYEGVRQTYEREDSTFDEVDYESRIYDKGRDLVLDGVKKGIFVQEADGSVTVDLSAEGLDKKVLLRKDGTTLYITQDMYLWSLRHARHRPQTAIVTTSAEQSYHFKVLKRIFELLEYPWAQNFRHLPYEHVYLGKNKMSSREGNTITADELVDTVKTKVKELMGGLEKLKGSAQDDRLVELLAFGAIKYGYLKYEPNTRIYFDLDQTIALEGKTGIYLQYTHARIHGILRKSKSNVIPAPPVRLWRKPGSSTPNVDSGSLTDALAASGMTVGALELSVLRKLQKYPDVVDQAAADYAPNTLCNYLFELSQAFNAFYQEAPVLSEADEDLRSFRLKLISAAAQVIKNGLALLGINAPEEM